MFSPPPPPPPPRLATASGTWSASGIGVWHLVRVWHRSLALGPRLASASGTWSASGIGAAAAGEGELPPASFPPAARGFVALFDAPHPPRACAPPVLLETITPVTVTRLASVSDGGPGRVTRAASAERPRRMTASRLVTRAEESDSGRGE